MEEVFAIINYPYDECRFIGYISGTEEEAKKYCDEYNKGVEWWKEIDYEPLKKLN